MIPALLLYLLQMQLALLALLGVYYGLLRRLTFHQLNRAYLLLALGVAAAYPALDLSSLLPAPTLAAVPNLLLLPAWPAAAPPAALTPGPDYGAWLLAVYWAGVGLMGAQLLVRLASLVRLHRASRVVQAGPVRYRVAAGVGSPFSFGRAVYLNPARHSPAELPTILLHEQVHVRQAHTLDVLLGHGHRVLAWCSPAAWWWLRAVQENLEFIADAAVLDQPAVSVRQYQYSLLQLSTLASGPALTTPFSFITLKNRIRMMNAQPSSARQLLRYAAGLLLLAGLAVSCATPKLAETPQPDMARQNTSSLDKVTFFLDGVEVSREQALATNSGVSSMYVFKGHKPNQGANMEALRRDFGSKLDDGIALVLTKANADSPVAQAFIAKYSIRPIASAEGASADNPTRVYYRKLVAGEGLSDEEIAGRLILINEQPATAQALRALPAGTVSVLAVSNDPLPKYGEEGKKGVIMIRTKDQAQ